MMKGGQPIRRLDRPVEGRPFLTPALIDVTNVAQRPDEELFGPVLQMIRVPDFDSAIAEAGNTRFGLSASLVGGAPQLYDRSEEHTSELQSLMRLSYAVFCFKKKKII